MLIKCPECELNVSNKASSCPHCGYPMSSVAPSNTRRRKNKRMRLPNGFGQITEIKGRNLRRPFRAMITVGKTEYGRPICKLLKPEAYFETYNDAYYALTEYNRNPYDIESNISLEDLYNKWSAQYFKTLKSGSSVRTIESAWSYCSSIKSMPASTVRSRHIKGCIDSCDKVNTKSRIKSMFNLMLDYAVEYEIIDKNYARTFNLDQNISEQIENAKRDHIAFTDDEMNILWNNTNVEYVDMILIQCYMGWRPKELLSIEIDNVNLDEKYIIGGMKTAAGTNRKIPIHSKIYDMVQKKYRMYSSLGSKYLFGDMTYDMYRRRFESVVKCLGLNTEHRAHDPRKHFVTMAKKYNVDEYAIKKFVGHSINDVTERIYTEREDQWYRKEIEKIH